MDQQTPVPTLSSPARLRPRREASGPVFSVAISRAVGIIVVTVHGALNVDSSGQLRHVLSDLIHQEAHPDVVVDIRDMTVGDGADLELFVDTAHCARERGGHLAVSGPSQATFAEFARGGLTTALDVEARGDHRPFYRPGR
jgi:anti-anti-sigma factor